MPTDAVSQRKVGRADQTMPPVLWSIESPSDLTSRCVELGADWFFVPMTVSNESIRALAPAIAKAHIVLGMDAAHFVLRSTRLLDERLAALGRTTCNAVMLQNVSLAEVKEGRTFHRFTQLRDQKRVELCFIDAQTHADAEWMVRHTPAHGVSTIFGLGDQTARYRMLAEAAEVATAIFARRPARPIWNPAGEISRKMDLSFIAAHPAITSVIEPLPCDENELMEIVESVCRPMPASDSDAWWESFRAQIAEPPKLRGGHPPDWA